MEITILVSSQNFNMKLAHNLSEEAKIQQINVNLIDLVSLNLPLYSSSEEQKNGAPDHLTTLANTLKNTDAMIFVAPEYNGSMPPVLNNAIAWLSRSSKDWRDCFNEKPAAIATHSGGGGSYVLMAMRQQLSYIGMNVIGRQLLTNFDKKLNDDSVKEIIKQLVKSI